MTQSTPTRRPRADAQRNRERIIDAAIEAFREEGLDVSVAEIARRAGVGSGTLFRNFPTKNDLIHAIVELHLNRWLEVIDQAIAAEDSREAFDEFFSEAVMFNCRDRGMLEAFKGGVMDDPDLHDCKCTAMDRTGELLAKAKKAGAVRRDVTTDDVYVLAAGAAETAKVAIREGIADPAEAHDRYVAIMLAGLRP